MGTAKIFWWESEVRDSELDSQGIVNNANYFSYLEHVRHRHLRSLGIDVVAWHNQGYDLVLVRTEINFKASLRSGDEFLISSQLSAKSRVRLLFEQQILRKNDRQIIVEAQNIGTCVARPSGKIFIPEQLRTLMNW